MCVCVCAYVCGVVLFEEASFGEFSGVFSRNTLQNDADLFDACIHLVQGTECSIFCNLLGRDPSEQLWGCLVWGPEF